MHEPYLIDVAEGIDWELASQIATTFGLLLAGVSAVLALLSYRSQIDNQANSHMHGLFNNYLSARLQPGVDAEGLETYRLYVLEEMVSWLGIQERELRTWGWLRPASYPRRVRELAAWKSTIRGNLGDPQAAWERIDSERSRASYGDEFRAFVQWCIKNPRPADPKRPQSSEDDPF